MADEKEKTVLTLLEEDDEFEEFEGGDWKDVKGESEDPQLWKDNWDDDDTTDEFTNQLRKHIEEVSKNDSSK